MNLEQARTNMLKQQLRTSGVLDDHLLEVIAAVPRDAYLPDNLKELAYADMALPLGHGVYTMTPTEEATFLQALSIKPTDKVLIAGVGHGYLPAVAVKLAKHVYAVDSLVEFVDLAKKNLQKENISRVTLVNAPTKEAWGIESPYDMILINGSFPELPESYPDALAVGGRLTAVVGYHTPMEAVFLKRLSATHWHREPLFETRCARLADVPEPEIFKF